MTKAILVLIVCLCIITGAVFAAEKPTASGMDTPITLVVKGEALSDIIAELTKQTGTRLRVTKDIADQKATIFVDNKPLKYVMDGLATIFGYRWSVIKIGTRQVYELWEPANLKRAREAAISGTLGGA